ncbi:MAG: caspase family protein [Ignavibacteria bacterium]|jgi:tetratricopeptide (TPR) repeat protein
MKKTIVILVFGLYALIVAQSNNFLPIENRLALVIGISNYSDAENNLNYADKDAEDFAEQLINFGRFKEENVKVLLNADATRENIRRNIEGWLQSSADTNTLVVIFFSGHGTQYFDYDNDEDDGMDEYLVTYNFDKSDFSTIISDDVFAYWIRNLKSKKIILFLDCCFSGGAAKQKGFLAPGVKGGIIKDDFSQDIIRELPKRGVCLLAASKSDQVSYESDEFNNGVFTHFLINSIKSQNDFDLNHVIDESELYNDIYRKTINYSMAKYNLVQEPIMLNNLDASVDLFYLPLNESVDKNEDKINMLFYRYEEEKDYDKQIKILEEIFELDPTNWRVHMHLASEYEYAGNFEQALYHYNYLISVDELNLNVWEDDIAEIYKKTGNFKDALQWYQKSLKKAMNPKVLYDIADVYLCLNDTSEAIKQLNLSIKANPYQKGSYNKLLYIYLNSNRLSTAYEIIKNSYEYNTSDLETIYWFARFKKFNKEILLGDSLLTEFYVETKLDQYFEKLEKEQLSHAIYMYNGVKITFEEHIKHDLEWEIRDYPYYAELYKAMLTKCSDILTTDEKTKYFQKYLVLSKLDPDIDFINAYNNNIE